MRVLRKRMMTTKTIAWQAFGLILLTLGALAQSGCGVLIGNVKPVEEKSTSYGVAELSKESKDWIRLDPTKVDGSAKEDGETPTEVSDVAYQSRKTASIISLNSACRPTLSHDQQDLRSLTNLLFLGMTNVSYRNEQGLELQGTPALQTTIRGRLNAEDMMLRTIVLRRGPCIYDLLYLARPNHFADQELDFSHFVASLRLK